MTKIITYMTALDGTELYFAMNKLITSKMGFPGKEIIDILKTNPKTTAITGSFTLNYISEDKTWLPNDIDIFTSEFEVFEELKNLFNEKCAFLGSPSNAKYIVEKNAYIQSVGSVIDVLEWSPRKKNKSQYKIQVILCQTDVDASIDSFDFNFVKAKYDGSKIIIPKETKEEIDTRISYLPNSYFSVTRFRNSVKRAKKYSSRGYNIIFPLEITIETVAGNPEFTTNSLKYELKRFKSVDSLYKVNPENNRLVRK